MLSNKPTEVINEIQDPICGYDISLLADGKVIGRYTSITIRDHKYGGVEIFLERGVVDCNELHNYNTFSLEFDLEYMPASFVKEMQGLNIDFNSLIPLGPTQAASQVQIGRGVIPMHLYFTAPFLGS